MVSKSDQPCPSCEFLSSRQVFLRPWFASGGWGAGLCHHKSAVHCALFLHASACGALRSTTEGMQGRSQATCPGGGERPVWDAVVAASLLFPVTRSACGRACPVMLSFLVGQNCPKLQGGPIRAPPWSVPCDACSAVCSSASGGGTCRQLGGRTAPDQTQPDQSVRDGEARGLHGSGDLWENKRCVFIRYGSLGKIR